MHSSLEYESYYNSTGSHIHIHDVSTMHTRADGVLPSLLPLSSLPFPHSSHCSAKTHVKKMGSSSSKGADVKTLTESGLPEEQAKKSVATYKGIKAGKGDTSTFYTHMVKDDGDVEEAKKHFNAYTASVKKARGHKEIFHTYNEDTKEIICIEVMTGPEAMDNHIGHAFPDYIKMIGAGVEMKECISICPADEVQWWTDSLKVWGADRLIVKARQ